MIRKPTPEELDDAAKRIMAADSCYNCKYYVSVFCYLKPPAPVIHPETDKNYPYISYERPEVDQDDFCSEFERRPDRPKE